MAEWKICDLAVQSYTPEGYPGLKQPMTPLFLLQTKYKGSKVLQETCACGFVNGNVVCVLQQKRKIKPQKRTLIRRRDVSLCPQSSLAMFLYERFVLDSEEDVDVLSPNHSWYCFLTAIQSFDALIFRYPIKIFRTRLDRTRVPSSSAIREERIKIGKQTGTGISGLANHYGRQLGSDIGKACGLSDAEVKSIGLWDLDTRSSHYYSGHDPTVVARLSGYPSLEAYSMPRGMASPETFASSHPQFKEIYSSFMPFTDSDSVAETADKARAKDSRTPAMVLKALSVLKRVFFQDLAWYRDHWPNLRMWDSAMFIQHKETLDEWIDYVASFEELGQPSTVAHGAIGVDALEFRLMREEMKAQNARLSRIATSLERQPTENESTRAIGSRKSANASLSGTLLVKQLRVMNGE